jgi:hypothetical protein
MFVKNKYDTCRVEVTKSDSATLVLGLPGNFGMKPISLNSQPNPQKKGPVLASPKTSGGTEKNEIRRRRQSERDCGLVDMDNGTYKSVYLEK